MKKIFTLFIFTIISLSIFAIDWNSKEWLVDGAGGGKYANKYKVAEANGLTTMATYQSQTEVDLAGAKVMFHWDITYNADKTLTFGISWDIDIPNLVVQLYIDNTHNLLLNENNNAKYTTQKTYLKGENLGNTFFLIEYSNNKSRINITDYKAGDTNKYHLEKVTSVTAGKIYAFVRNGKALIAPSASSLLTEDVNFGTIDGTQNFLWRLVSDVDGFKLNNISKGEDRFLRNSSSTNLVLSDNESLNIWTITFDGDFALIAIQENERFIGEREEGLNEYRSYPIKDLEKHGHDFTVYELVEGEIIPSLSANKLDLKAIKTESLPFELDTNIVVTASNLTADIAVSVKGKNLTVADKLPKEGGKLNIHINASNEGAFSDTIVLSSGSLEVKVAVEATIQKVAPELPHSEIPFEETFFTRRGDWNVERQLTSDGKETLPYANQWFEGYTTLTGTVKGNQYDNDYTSVSSYNVTVRSRKLNGSTDKESTVGLQFSRLDYEDQCFVKFVGGLPDLKTEGYLHFEISPVKEDNGNLAVMVVKVNGETLKVPATTLGNIDYTTAVTIPLPKGAIDSLYFAFDKASDYRFISRFWIDDNPNSYPEEKKYTITVSSNDTKMGVVRGGGTYTENTSIAISAVANSGYRFVRWNDGNTKNPRAITVTKDETYTAYFAKDASSWPSKQVWPIIMDDQTFTKNQQYVIGDFRVDDVDNFLYIWANTETYNICDASGRNFYGNKEGYVSLVVAAPNGWSGGGFSINNADAITAMQALKDAIVANPDDYFLHLGIKAANTGSHEFYTFGETATAFNIGTAVIEKGPILGDFARDGEWHEFYIPLAQFATAIASANVQAGINILCFLSGAQVGAQLNLDAVYFCNKAYKEAQEAMPKPKTVKIGDLYYTLDESDGTSSVVGTECKTAALSIPATIIYEKQTYNVTEIGESAFADCTELETLSLGENILSIADYAFSGCKRLLEIYSYADRTPDLTATSFNNVGNKKMITVYVPEGRLKAYQKDELWSAFDLQVKSATQVETTSNEVTVEPDETSVDLIWPTSQNVATYDMTIYGPDGKIVCRLIFDYEGRLRGIDFSTTANHAPKRAIAAQQVETAAVAGLQFTVTNLDKGTEYAYSLDAKDETDQVIKHYTGKFTTKGSADPDPTPTTYSFAVSYTGNGTVTSDKTNGKYESGTKITIEATPDATWTFSGWSDGVKDAQRTITLTQDTNLVAAFVSSQKFKVTISAGAGGSVSPELKDAEYEGGAILHIEAKANSGYRFNQWSDNDKQAKRDIVITKDIELKATFVEVETCTLRVEIRPSDKAGIIYFDDEVSSSLRKIVEIGTAVEVKAKAATGYSFARFEDGEDNITSSTYSVTLNKSKTITALFKKDEEALDELTNDQSPMTNKIIRDNQLFILRGEKVYTLTGQEVR